MPFREGKIESAPEEESRELSGDRERGPVPNGTVEKEALWRKKQEEVEKITDVLGYEVEERIKESVVAFNMMGLPTSASCEGHIDRKSLAPWVEVASPNMPKERFIGEKESLEKIVEKYNVSAEDVSRDIHHKAYLEFVRDPKRKKETPEYIKWRKENEKLMAKAKKLLEDFYEKREVSAESKLIIEERGESGFLVSNQGGKFEEITENFSEEEKEGLIRRLAKYQKEMKDFSKFLKTKYFEESEKLEKIGE